MLLQRIQLLSVALALLSAPIQKRDTLLKRDATSVDLQGNGLGYNINFTIDGQEFVGILDTGSSDVWVPSSDGCQPDSKRGVDCKYTFNPDNSSSFERNSSSNPLNITYSDGSGATGYFAQDTIAVGSVTLSEANFAVATQADSPPIFGIGPPAGENTYYKLHHAHNGDRKAYNSGGDLYRNFPMQLKDAGFISSTAYSSWLNNPKSYEGHIVFGGVDYAKINGSLYTVPIEYEPLSYYSDGIALTLPDITHFLVMVDNITLYTGNGSQTLMQGPYPALLDSGSTRTSVPAQLADRLLEAFHADSTNNYIDCGLPEGNIGANIRGRKFFIPFDVFVRPQYNYDGQELIQSNGDVLCSPGIRADDDTPFLIFGQSFLDALYIVYDLDFAQVSIGQALFDVTDENLQEISDLGVPSASKAPEYSTIYSGFALDIASELSFSVSVSAVETISDDKASRSTLSSASDTDAATTSAVSHTRSLGATSYGSLTSGSQGSGSAASSPSPAAGSSGSSSSLVSSGSSGSSSS